MRFVLKSLISIIVLVVLLSLSQTATKSQSDLKPARSHEVTYIVSTLAKDKSFMITGTRTRLVLENGQWKETYHKSGVKTANDADPAIAHLADGEYLIGPDGKQEKARDWDNFREPAKFHSTTFLKTHPALVRVEVIADLEAYVLRNEYKDPNDPFAWVEMAFSPDTGYTPLAIRVRFRNGSEKRIEANRVVFKDIKSLE